MIENASDRQIHTENSQNALYDVVKVKFLPESYYTSYLSDRARIQRPSPIRSLLPLEDKPNIISLLAGKPNASMFPFASISFTANSPTDPSKLSAYDLTGRNLEEALQYGPTDGMPQLLEWVMGLQAYAHGRKKNEGWRTSVGIGSQDVLFKALQIIVNPGDAILTESPAYAGAIPIFQALNTEIIDINTDADGIDASSLRSTLENWPENKPMPKVLYTVPYGCNPTGVTTSLKRRREVLALAKKYNFLILEDDPYYFLYFGNEERPPSYFALELELEEVGRVLRFDSLSKILSAGMRLGFLSGPEPILKMVDLYTSSSNLQVPSLTQAIAYTLLKSWGYDGFMEHTTRVSDFYRSKRDLFENALSKHLGDIAVWNTPISGMFFWFKLLLKTSEESMVEEDSEALIRDKAFEKGVLALPGTVFLPGGEKTAYVRAAFSLLEEEDVNEALRRLRTVVLEARNAAT